MEHKELSEALKQHKDKGGTYQIHLNATSVEDSKRIKGIEFSDLYFTNCGALQAINGDVLLFFGNENKKPIYQKEDGTNIYPMESNSGVTINMNQIEAIEEVEDTADWFSFPSERIINLYMLPESKDMNGNRNVVSIGLME